MKIKFIGVLVAAVVTTMAHGATTVTAFNAAGGAAGFVQQVQFQGAPYTGASIMVGTFSNTSGLGEGSISLAAQGWSAFGTAPFSTNAIAPGVFGAFGAAGQALSVTDTLPTTASGPFIGNNIFLVIANPTSTDFIIWDSGAQFATEDALLGGVPVSVQTRNATLVRGLESGENTGLGGPLGAFNGQTAVTFIPEPSTALLGLIGALGLLRRRR